MGDGAGSVTAYSPDALKCLNGSEFVCEASQATTIYRSLHTDYGMIDCPQPWMYESAAIWQDAVQLRPGYDYYEIQNECPPPPGGYVQWARWSIEMAKYVQQQTGGALLAFSFAAGNPDYRYWPELIEYFKWVADNPLPNGTYHGIAIHAAPNAGWSRADSPWVNNDHLTVERLLVYVRSVVLRETGYDLQDWPGTVAFTEWGLTGGYSGNWTARYSCEEKADAYKSSIAVARKLRWAGTTLMLWWNIGAISIWQSDHECLPLFFQ